MCHKIFKVVRRMSPPHYPSRSRISSSTRHPQFTLTYPVVTWLTVPIGLSFVFVDEDAARTYHREYTTVHNHLELWMCQSEDEPQRLYGMASHWAWIELFWKYHHDHDLLGLAKVCIACPDTYYGVKTLRLFSRLD